MTVKPKIKKGPVIFIVLFIFVVLVLGSIWIYQRNLLSESVGMRSSATFQSLLEKNCKSDPYGNSSIDSKGLPISIKEQYEVSSLECTGEKGMDFVRLFLKKKGTELGSSMYIYDESAAKNSPVIGFMGPGVGFRGVFKSVYKQGQIEIFIFDYLSSELILKGEKKIKLGNGEEFFVGMFENVLKLDDVALRNIYNRYEQPINEYGEVVSRVPGEKMENFLTEVESSFFGDKLNQNSDLAKKVSDMVEYLSAVELKK